MLRWRWLAAALMIAAAPSAMRGDEIDVQSVDRYVEGRMRSARIPGLAVAIVTGDRIVYLNGYGRADPNGRAVTPQTPFTIGSIAKPFTALATMQLVEAGRIELDAPVRRYIPWFRVADSDASAQITVRHLLTMTSGLPQLYETQLWTDRDEGALERGVRFLATKRLARPVGTSSVYSNANYEVLGLLVQVVSGESYEAYVKEHIYAPLEMRNSFVSADEARRHGMATGHRWWFGFPVAVTFPENRAELPAGYLVSSAEDIGHFLIAQMNGGRYRDRQVLSAKGMALIHAEPPPGAYGMGWESIRIDGHRLISHDGGTASFQTSLFFDQEARVGVFVAANVVNALDAFSSRPGTSPLDGLTVREMAVSILHLATNRPPPPKGIGHERLTLIFNVVILLLTVALVISLIRLPKKWQRLAQPGRLSRTAVVRHVTIAAIVNFTLAVVLLSLARAPAWGMIAAFQPDLVYWLYAVAIVLVLRGLAEIEHFTVVSRAAI